MGSWQQLSIELRKTRKVTVSARALKRKASATIINNIYSPYHPRLNLKRDSFFISY